MDAHLKEKLIEIVRKYECLYNTKHEEYKNKNYKLLLWERIGATLEIEGNIAKETWRTLRDGYVRYKKHVPGKTGSGRKYSHYMWSSQLAFLDGTLELRPANTNTSAPQAGSESPESQTSRKVSPFPLQPLSPEPSYAGTPPAQDNVLEYLHNDNRKRQHDDVDHLFTSYAKTFKKLSPRNRAELKISLAKLFAEAELRELDSDFKIKEPPLPYED